MYGALKRIFIPTPIHKLLNEGRDSVLLRVLSDKKCLDILKIISVEPSYVSELASTLKTRNSRISEKMKVMKDAGIVSEEWRRTGNRLVKFYRPLVKEISVSLADGSIKTETKGNGENKNALLQDFDTEIPATDQLIGRKGEVQYLEKHPQVLVTGIPGIGKTTLVANFLRSSNREVFWHTVRETDTLKNIIMEFASYLDRKGDDSLVNSLGSERDRRTHVNLVISGMRKLNSAVVFDDLQRCLDNEIFELVNDLVYSVPALKVILISRNAVHFYRSSIKTLTLQELQPEDALALVGNNPIGRKIVDEVGGHPLIIKLAKSLQSSGMKSERGLSPRDYFERQILPTLPKEIIRILEKVSFFRGNISLEELEFVFGEISKPHLNSAVDMGLIRMQKDSIRMNDLVRESLQASASNKSEIHKKISLYYCSMKKPESLITGLHHLKLAEDSSEISSFLNQYGIELINSSYLNNFQEELIQIEKGLESGGPKAEVLYWIGKILSSKRNYRESLKYFERARMCPQPPSLGPALLYDEATAILNLGEYEKSEELFWDALKKVHGSGSIQEGRILYGLGTVLTSLGKHREARNSFQRSANIFKSNRDLTRYYVNLFGSANLEFVSGNIKKALKLNNEATEGFLNTDALNSYTSSLLSRGDFLFHSGKQKRGIDVYGKAIEILETLKYADLDLAFALLKRSIMFSSSGEGDKAELDIKVARKIVKAKGDDFLNGYLCLAEGTLRLSRGELDRAEELLRVAMKYEKLDPIAMYRVRREWGILLIKKGLVNEGRKVIRDLMRYFRKKKYVIFLNETLSIYKEIAN
jgi:tetratricopeptide (TPR) repeat protein